MPNEKRFPRLHATSRNSLVWGVAWGTFGTGVAFVMRLIDNIPFGYALLDGLGMGFRIGVMGAIAGAAFFAFISVAYRGKRLSESAGCASAPERRSSPVFSCPAFSRR